jgi:hypothetical protein
MPLIEFIRHTLPSAYWSAGFIACLVCVMVLSTVLYIISRYPAWIITFLAAAVYTIPVLTHQQW